MARQRPTRLVLGPCIIEIDRIVIRDVQYKFEVIRCRNEEVNFQGSMARTDRRTDRQTDRRTAEITTISPRFSKSCRSCRSCLTIHFCKGLSARNLGKTYQSSCTLVHGNI
ncbi:hypothetical protein DPMN_121239 [Dreissena polymorpha]|uniref:Uncharacterized protein n=1 Tax=Dreissena polymorpha TaxID=45954 RepID=A0A9D4JPB7_DREPO|nr:hypothetical protein DPMN_121239 [Dreissena polymorpha]